MQAKYFMQGLAWQQLNTYEGTMSHRITIPKIVATRFSTIESTKTKLRTVSALHLL